MPRDKVEAVMKEWEAIKAKLRNMLDEEVPVDELKAMLDKDELTGDEAHALMRHIKDHIADKGTMVALILIPQKSGYEAQWVMGGDPALMALCIMQLNQKMYARLDD